MVPGTAPLGPRPSGSMSGTSTPSSTTAIGDTWCSSWLALTPSSFCFVPAQIWYSAVTNTLATATAMPKGLPDTCESEMVERKMPSSRTAIEPSTAALARRE